MPAQDELPVNEMDWTVHADRAVLLIHDMQQYFLSFFPSGQPLDTLVDNVVRLRTAAVRAGVPVVYTAQPGGMTQDERGLLRDIWGPGMDKDPGKRRVVPELAPDKDDLVLTKWRYSAFARSPLSDHLSALGRDQLIVAGVYAHVGCLMTAAAAYERDIQAFLVADAIADFDAEYHRMALRYAAERCAMTVPTASVISELTARTANEKLLHSGGK